MDFDKTLIDVSQKDEVIVEKFASLHPGLSKWVDNRDDKIHSLSIPQIIKYIVCCYDKESPYVYLYKKRWTVKKRESAIFANFSTDENGHFSKDGDSIIFCENNVINKLVLRYLYLQHDRLYTTYVIYNEMYLHQSAELLEYNFQQPSHAKAAKENLDTLDKDIEELEFKIFSGEESKKMKDLLYEESINLLNELRPEKIAIRIENGLPPVDFNPYGEYKKEKMIFVSDT